MSHPIISIWRTADDKADVIEVRDVKNEIDGKALEETHGHKGIPYGPASLSGGNPRWKPPMGGFYLKKWKPPSMPLAIKWGVSTFLGRNPPRGVSTGGFPLDKLAGPYGIGCMK